MECNREKAGESGIERMFMVGRKRFATGAAFRENEMSKSLAFGGA